MLIHHELNKLLITINFKLNNQLFDQVSEIAKTHMLKSHRIYSKISRINLYNIYNI